MHIDVTLLRCLGSVFCFMCVCVCVFACVCRDSDATAPAHTYASPGDYTVRISGRMSAIGFGQPGTYGGLTKHKDSAKLVDVLQWGCVRFGNRGGYFYECENLGRLSARDLPDLTGVTNMKYMFRGDRAFQSDLSGWDVSKVTDMEVMFFDARAFQLPDHAPWYRD